MKKRLLVLVCATLLLVGCGNASSNNDTSKGPTTDTTIETESEVESEKEPEIDQNAWKSGKFTLYGTELQIGVSTFGEIVNAIAAHDFDDEYTVENRLPYYFTSENKSLNAGVTGRTELHHLGYKKPTGNIQFHNPTDSELDKLKCTVVYFNIQYGTQYDILDVVENKENKPEFVIPNGVTFGTSRNDVEKLLGTPTRIENDFYIYESDTFKIVLDLRSEYVSEIRYLLLDKSKLF